MPLCFATNNLHKLQEVKAVLGGGFTLLSLQDIGCTEELPETQLTISGNAHQKAKYVWDHYQVPCFADDSGLEVAALHGRPGVDSAHYAGPQRSAKDNIQLVLKNMMKVQDRSARFVTVIALQTSSKALQFEGILEGTILMEPRGNGGFGYDPVFLPQESDRTLAEMSLEEKNGISHRSKAVKKLAEFLKRDAGNVRYL